MAALPLVGMVALSVTCSAIAQILLKHGMANPGVQRLLTDQDYWALATRTATDLPIIGGFLLYAFGAVIWLFVLARLDVSVAYPFVAVGFLITMVLGCLVFGEVLTLQKVAGTLIVGVGIYLVATAS